MVTRTRKCVLHPANPTTPTTSSTLTTPATLHHPTPKRHGEMVMIQTATDDVIQNAAGPNKGMRGSRGTRGTNCARDGKGI